MEYLKVGYIRKPHGLKGEIKILPLTNNIERFKKIKNIFLKIDNQYFEYKIDRLKLVNDNIIMKLTGFDQIEQIEHLRDHYLFIPKDEGEELDQWEYYSQDLIDCIFYYHDKELGKVHNFYNTGSCDIFEIQYNNKIICYPFLKQYIDHIDIKNKRIDINQFEGFFD